MFFSFIRYLCKRQTIFTTMIRQKKILLTCVVTILLLSSCTHHYQLASVERSRILIDSRYDANPDEEAATLMTKYKGKVDSLMGPVLGKTAKYLAAYRPESELSNLLTDILVWASKEYNEQADFAVYNIGGMRAALAKGDVTIGDIYEIAPFENKICFITLKGADVTELFHQIATRGGEGVSHEVQLVIDKSHSLLSAKLNGKDIDSDASYRIATIDYMAQGNDGMTAFKKGTDLKTPAEEKDNSRFIIMNYFRDQQSQGKVVDANKEGRIVVR